MSFTEFYRVLPGFTSEGKVSFIEIHLVFKGFLRLLTNFTEFYRVLPVKVRCLFI